MKTVDELMQQIREYVVARIGQHESICDESWQGRQDKANAMESDLRTSLTESIPQWRPIEEYDVPKNRHALMFGDGEAIKQCVYVGFLSSAHDDFRLFGANTMISPTHYQPLPQPPKEG